MRDSESRCVTRSRVESPCTHEMKGASFQEVLSGFPGLRLPSRRPLDWQCDSLCELSSHEFFMKAELEEIVKNQTTAFATFSMRLFFHWACGCLVLCERLKEARHGLAEALLYSWPGTPSD